MLRKITLEREFDANVDADLSKPVLPEREFDEGISSRQRQEGEDEENEDCIRQVLSE